MKNTVIQEIDTQEAFLNEIMALRETTSSAVYEDTLERQLEDLRETLLIAISRIVESTRERAVSFL